MRRTTLFDSDWKFARGAQEGAEAANYSDRSWRTLDLPHDWAIEGPFDAKWASATGYLPAGTGWYRKSFHVDALHADQRVLVQFDGVYCNSDVWLNGHHVGNRPNGFIGFTYDLTPYLNRDGVNVLAVRVNHEHVADSRWYTGSGIYRHVYLIVTAPVRVAPSGIRVMPTKAEADEATVEICVSLLNHLGREVNVEVEHTISGPTGEVVAHATAKSAIGAEGVLKSECRVAQPQRWSPDSPSLYSLKTVVHHEDVEVEVIETPFGIRSIRFDADEGFFLNGKNLKFKGVCIHDDAGALGVAVPAKVWERRLETLKECGVNAIRMAHNPHMPELYHLCDRMGLLVQDEAFDEWEGAKNKWVAGWNVGEPAKHGYSEFFKDWSDVDLRDMIVGHLNHPSIVMWSIGNEVDYPNDPYSHEILNHGTNPQIYGQGFKPDYPHSNRLGEIARHLVSVAKQYDTSRPITAALASALISNETGYAQALDVVGYNYLENRYAPDHQRFPKHVLYGSENGMWWSFWKSVTDNAYISGQFLWTGIDYLGEAGQWPVRSNGAGILDLAGMPKPEYYFRKALWSSDPSVYIGYSPVSAGDGKESLWSHKAAEPVWHGKAGDPVCVNCFTNCDEVELFCGSRSLGRKIQHPHEEPILSWELPYTGETLVARAFRNGKEVALWELRTPGAPTRLSINADASKLGLDPEEVAHVVVRVLDANGTVVHDAHPRLNWSVSGGGRLMGLENGDHASHEDYKGTSRRAFRGFVLGYVKPTNSHEPIKITVTAEGCEPATVTLNGSVESGLVAV